MPNHLRIITGDAKAVTNGPKNANANGACPKKFKAIPQLRYTLTYEVPPGPKFAVDSFPEEEHNPITDHADFEAVLSTELWNRIADCINSGRTCDNS
jgi:hypothetical protein